MKKKQNKAKKLLFNFALKQNEKSEAKLMRNRSRFALKRKIFVCETRAPFFEPNTAIWKRINLSKIANSRVGFAYIRYEANSKIWHALQI
jgi:hypothetical protein